MCTDGTCKASALECVADIQGNPRSPFTPDQPAEDPVSGECSDPLLPYLCQDGKCRAEFSQCICPLAAPYMCSSGRCVKTKESCETISACPVDLPKRCPDGSCAASDAQCNLVEPCKGSTKRCVDGICRSECPNFDGCPANLPLRCPNGVCLNAANTTCALINDESPTCKSGMYKCIDGTCQQDPLDCPPTLREYPVVSSTVTQTCHPKQQEIHLSSYKGRSVAKIFFPSGVLGTCSPSTIGFKSVSLSNLMQVRNPIDETRLNEFKNNITELPFERTLISTVVDVYLPNTTRLIPESKFQSALDPRSAAAAAAANSSNSTSGGSLRQLSYSLTHHDRLRHYRGRHLEEANVTKDGEKTKALPENMRDPFIHFYENQVLSMYVTISFWVNKPKDVDFQDLCLATVVYKQNNTKYWQCIDRNLVDLGNNVYSGNTNQFYTDSGTMYSIIYSPRYIRPPGGYVVPYDFWAEWGTVFWIVVCVVSFIFLVCGYSIRRLMRYRTKWRRFKDLKEEGGEGEAIIQMFGDADKDDEGIELQTNVNYKANKLRMAQQGGAGILVDAQSKQMKKDMQDELRKVKLKLERAQDKVKTAKQRKHKKKKKELEQQLDLSLQSSRV